MNGARKALVVYESMFGNTRIVAEAIADGLAGSLETDLAEVGTLSDLPTGVGLLVVGGPTHAFGMSRSSTRKSAVRYTDSELISTGQGIREWVKVIGPDARGVRFVAFDTRVRPRRVPGSAARAVARRLRRAGAIEVAEPTTFFVEGMTGPLGVGERERARSFGQSLGHHIPSPPAEAPETRTR